MRRTNDETIQNTLMKYPIPYVFLLSIMLLISNSCTATSQKPRMLITQEEAERPSNKQVIVAVSEGPEIVILRPNTEKDHTGPMIIEVVFKPSSDGCEPDMSTFKLEYIKFLTIDITNRVLEFIHGNILKTEEIDIPKGKHTLSLSLKDKDGKETIQIIKIRRL